MLDSLPTTTNQQVEDNNSSESESESEIDHFTMTVGQILYWILSSSSIPQLGGKVYALNDITQELIAKMTEEEKQTYTSLCREAYDDLF